MITKLLEYLFGKPKIAGPYPFGDDLREYLPHQDSVKTAINLIRHTMGQLGVSQSQAEIILFVLSCNEPVTLARIEDEITHITNDHAAKLVRQLLSAGYLTRACRKDCIVIYSVNPVVASFFKR